VKLEKVRLPREGGRGEKTSGKEVLFSHQWRVFRNRGGGDQKKKKSNWFESNGKKKGRRIKKSKTLFSGGGGCVPAWGF